MQLRLHRDALSAVGNGLRIVRPAVGTRNQLIERGFRWNVLRHGTVPALRFGGPTGAERSLLFTTILWGNLEERVRGGSGGRRNLRPWRRTLERNKAQEGAGRPLTGNGGGLHQTRRRSKASKPALPILPPRQSWNR
jgi:hypothetical protein